MVDPLAEVVTPLQPGASYSKIVGGAGRWRVRRSEAGRPFYCVILDGSCHLAIDSHEPITLMANDFVLIPSASNFYMSSLEPPSMDETDASPVALPDGEFRLGIQGLPPDVRLLVGYCVFGSPDAALLVSLLPLLVHVRGEKRLTTLVQLVGEESRGLRPARDVILARLLEVLPMEYLLAWRMALAKNLLRRKEGGIAEVAQRVGYSSASTFSVAFTRHVGLPPTRYAQEQIESRPTR
jgi:AraC-like DNA-binding protein